MAGIQPGRCPLDPEPLLRRNRLCAAGLGQLEHRSTYGFEPAAAAATGSPQDPAAGRYRTSLVNDRVLGDDDTLLALQVNGETLSLDHGFPVRLIAPNRPGVMQTKWVIRLVVR